MKETVLLSIKDVASYTGWAISDVRKKVHRADFPAYKEGKYWWTHKVKLDEWINRKITDKTKQQQTKYHY